MNNETMLLRQVNPLFVVEGRLTSQIFRPTDKDDKRLSVYDGDLISPEDSWDHFTTSLGFRSKGVLGVTVDECESSNLTAEPDNEPFPEHAIISFESCETKGAIRTAGKKLNKYAAERYWLYQE